MARHPKIIDESWNTATTRHPEPQAKDPESFLIERTRVPSGFALRMTLFFLLLICWSGLAQGYALKEPSTLTSPVRRVWSSSLKKQTRWLRNPYQFARLAADDEKIYVGVEKAVFYAIRLKNGRKAWKFQTQGAVESTPALDDTTVYFGDAKGQIYALDKQNGRLQWNTKVDAPVVSSPLLDGATLYVVNTEKKLSAFDKKTGYLLWQTLPLEKDRNFTVFGNAGPVKISGLIWVGYADGSLVAYSPEDGAIRFVKQLGNRDEVLHDIDASPWVGADRFFVPTADGGLYALSAKDGKILWHAPHGGVNETVVDQEVLYVTAQGVVSALKADEGQVLWEQDLSVPEISPPALVGDLLVTVATRGKIYFIDRHNGDLLHARYLSKGSYSAPLVRGNRFYLLSNRGVLSCFELK